MRLGTLFPHGLKRIGDQIDENLLAKLAVHRNFGQTLRILLFNFYVGVRKGSRSGFEGVIDNFGDILRLQFKLRGTGEIEEANDQRIQAIHLGGDVACQLRNERLRPGNFLIQHFR